MKTDRELLELAARAAGLNLYFADKTDGGLIYTYVQEGDVKHLTEWNPLKDDGDALRLAVYCGIEIFPDLQCSEISTAFSWKEKDGRILGKNTYEDINDHQGDFMSAARWAIVTAAAEIQLQKDREQ